MFIQEVATQQQHNIGTAFELGFAPEIVFLKNQPPEVQQQYISNLGWDIHSTGIAIKRPEGYPLTFSKWYSEGDYFSPIIAIKDKYMLTEEQGPELEENCITMFHNWSPALDIYFEKMANLITEKEPGYIGLVAMDVILSQNAVYYRNIKFTENYDYFYCMAKLNGVSLEKLSDNLRDGIHTKSEGFAASLRLYAYPYNSTKNKGFDLSDIETHEIDDCMIKCGRGDTIKNTWKDIYKDLSQYTKHGLCYRTDGSDRARRTYNMLKREKYL